MCLIFPFREGKRDLIICTETFEVNFSLFVELFYIYRPADKTLSRCSRGRSPVWLFLFSLLSVNLWVAISDVLFPSVWVSRQQK